MTGQVSLSSGLGEVVAPQTLMMPLVMTPEGAISIEPGALHGRSHVEGAVQFVQKRDELTGGQRHWIIWVAVELDPANQPVRYKGIAVSELWVDPSTQRGYKSVAESVNRMAEAMRGGVNFKTMTSAEKAAIKQQLMTLSPETWQRSSQPLKDALT